MLLFILKPLLKQVASPSQKLGVSSLQSLSTDRTWCFWYSYKTLEIVNLPLFTKQTKQAAFHSGQAVKSVLICCWEMREAWSLLDWSSWTTHNHNWIAWDSPMTGTLCKCHQSGLVNSTAHVCYTWGMRHVACCLENHAVQLCSMQYFCMMQDAWMINTIAISKNQIDTRYYKLWPAVCWACGLWLVGYCPVLFRFPIDDDDNIGDDSDEGDPLTSLVPWFSCSSRSQPQPQMSFRFVPNIPLPLPVLFTITKLKADAYSCDFKCNYLYWWQLAIVDSWGLCGRQPWSAKAPGKGSSPSPLDDPSELIGQEDIDGALEDLFSEEIVNAAEEPEPAEPLGPEAEDADSQAQSSAADPSPVQPSPPPTRKGNTIFSGDVRCGSIHYLFHWDPPAFSGKCCLHGPRCYVTGDLNKVSDEEMSEWLQRGLECSSAEEHLALKPKDSYNQRRRPSKAVWFFFLASGKAMGHGQKLKLYMEEAAGAVKHDAIWFG